MSGREGKREAGKNREASRHGVEEEKGKKEKTKKRQMERPELVAATDPRPNNARNSKPRAQGHSILAAAWTRGQQDGAAPSGGRRPRRHAGAL